MGYLDILRNDAKLAENFDTLFDFRLLDALEERDTAEGRCTFSVPGMAFADFAIQMLYALGDVHEDVIAQCQQMWQ